MRFGKTLRESMYPPWKAQYMDYRKLKQLLRDNEAEAVSDADDTDGGEPRPWTEEDENRFCDEVFNVQLEKVAGFQEAQLASLRDRADALLTTLGDLPRSDEAVTEEGAQDADADAMEKQVTDVEVALDQITNEVRQLKRFSSLNYTGFCKIVKKHDRRRGSSYRIRPMMQVSLARRPFNAEGPYAPLLSKLSLLYEAVHQYRHTDEAGAAAVAAGGLETQNASTASTFNGERYRSFKFWIHPDNLLEVKTMVLRHLPALVYSDSSSKEADATADPTLTSLYFDNKSFELYNAKLEGSSASGGSGESGNETATSLRLRWSGPLAARPALTLDQKLVDGTGTSQERRIAIKDKYVKPFLDGAYAMDKSIAKMERQGERPATVKAFQQTAGTIQAFVRERGLEPVLRANYVRTAFQKPADDRVRVSIDTDLAFVREDTLDRRRPCRDPNEWHRRDLDAPGAAGYPFANLPPSDVARFPFAVLEIKVREDVDDNTATSSTAATPTPRKRPAWVEDLMASHLVHPAPQFSTFVHGIAVLFDDYVNRLPAWLSDLDRDIRRDPQEAFEEEELRRAQRVADEQVVGSFLGGSRPLSTSYRPAQSPPAGRAASYVAERLASEASLVQRVQLAQAEQEAREQTTGQRHQQTEAAPKRSYGGAISSVLPSFSVTRYARWRRARDGDEDGNDEDEALPAGVQEPKVWLKNAGPLHIEPKVWLANERTFLKWQHISVLLGSLSVALFTAAGGHGGSAVATWLGVVYLAVAVFAGLWGRHMLQTRRAMILARSGRDFDNMVGPVIVSIALMGALLLNLAFAFRSAIQRWQGEAAVHGTRVL